MAAFNIHPGGISKREDVDAGADAFFGSRFLLFCFHFSFSFFIFHFSFFCV